MVVNAAWVRAYRPNNSPSGSATGPVKLAGTPTGTATPTPSRSRPMSSIATHQLRPAKETGSARLAANNASSQPPTSAPAGASGYLVGGQRAQQPQQVGHRLGVACRPFGRKMLQLKAGGRNDLGVEQLAKLDAAEQLSEQRGVQRQRGGTAFGQRAVALVHERPDVAEQQRGRERGRRRGLGFQHAYFPRG